MTENTNRVEMTREELYEELARVYWGEREPGHSAFLSAMRETKPSKSLLRREIARLKSERQGAKQSERTELNSYRDECHNDAVARGWWIYGIEKDSILGRYEVAAKIALIHSEISEALEGIRKDSPDQHLPHRPAGEVELVDALIRIFDLAGAMGYDLDGAYVEKRAYNKTRADHDKETREQPNGKKF